MIEIAWNSINSLYESLSLQCMEQCCPNLILIIVNHSHQQSFLISDMLIKGHCRCRLEMQKEEERLGSVISSVAIP